MKKIFILLLFIQIKSFAQQYDVCVYGGTSAGVIAAYTAAKQNKKVILIEPGKHLGGLSSGGLGLYRHWKQICRYRAWQEISTGEWANTMANLKHGYLNHMWPNISSMIISKKQMFRCCFNTALSKPPNKMQLIQSIEIQNLNPAASTLTKTITAKMFIDCSYEGDLMAKAGVHYIVGGKTTAFTTKHGMVCSCSINTSSLMVLILIKLPAIPPAVYSGASATINCCQTAPATKWCRPIISGLSYQ